MTRDELEAVIWRAATFIGANGKPGRLLGPAAVDTILHAADQYATAQAVDALHIADDLGAS
jgi:hypothetical protein